ncbi:hypothetical protein [Alkalicoccobacillus porphyridii]|uniref:Histone deacetylase n=1 Tax=Alkalicoccobacillus porphyridii TaxID=2597270 RepID=A0A554A054_9BACI|nr:hypothetical protein [Alkalicoccobacillus porphyridii]TSB47070.1 hypothetical protein FN960_08625 [Alkalicoccobacillus porphyridii]
MNLVWYVSYGSNLMEERFHCYIKGGIPIGSTQAEKGCRDTTLPLRNRSCVLPYPLYFAKDRSKWGEGGVAFIGHKEDPSEQTIARQYLITFEQFVDVVEQENQADASGLSFDELMEKGSVTLDDGWYGRVVYLGMDEGYPKVTFTNPLDLGTNPFYAPAKPYADTISKGLHELGYTFDETYTYLSSRKGFTPQAGK